MNSQVYLFLPRFDETRICKSQRKSCIFKRNIKIFNFQRNNLNRDKIILKEIDFLKKTSKNVEKVEEKEPSPKRIYNPSFSNEKIIKPPTIYHKPLKTDLSQSIQVKKIVNLTNTSFDCFNAVEENFNQKPRYSIKSAILRGNPSNINLNHNPTKSLIGLKKKEKSNTTIAPKNFSYKKIEYEYFSKLKFSNGMSKSVSNFKIHKNLQKNTFRVTNALVILRISLSDKGLLKTYSCLELSISVLE